MLTCSRLIELNLSNNKSINKVLTRLCDVIKMKKDLNLLDLSNVQLDPISCQLVGQLLKRSTTIQHLNLSFCGLKGQNAKVIIDALMHNSSVKFVNFCWNNLSSSDYSVAS